MSSVNRAAWEVVQEYLTVVLTLFGIAACAMLAKPHSMSKAAPGNDEAA